MSMYSTYARAVLSYSESLAELIIKYSIPPAETRRTGESAAKWKLLTLKQIHEALLNPQSSLHMAIQSYALQLKIYKEIFDTQADTREQATQIETALKNLREKYARADANQQREFMKAIQELENRYKMVASLQKNLAELVKELPNIDTQFNELNRHQDINWENFRKTLLEKIKQGLTEKDLSLTDLEINELESLENMAEIIKRFKTQSLEIPSFIDIQHPNYQTYFELKTYLAIHASLSRRMLPHSPEDIEKW